MISAPLPPDENQRLQKLRSYNILDTADEKAYDDIVHLVSQICGTPIANISFVDADRQWFKAAVGLEGRETNRDIAFCAHTILGDELMVVEDALEDERFFDNPLVQEEPGVRFYAGMPLVSPEGLKLGSLCAIDRVPRQLTGEQKLALSILSRHVIDLLELRQRNRELEELSQYKSKLLAILAHDMRSPLNNISSLLSLFKETTLGPEERSELLAEFDRSMEATRGLLDNLTEWVTRTLGQEALSVRQEPMELRRSVEEVIDQLGPKASAKGISLVNGIPAPVEMATDQDILRFILRNLVDNGIKFTAEGSVRVDSYRDDNGNTLTLQVTDTGIGMGEEKLKRLFSWEKRSSAPGTSGERGSGLALALSAEMANLLGGRLSATSRLGYGTTITLELPHSVETEKAEPGGSALSAD